jgi:hypothetical protein
LEHYHAVMTDKLPRVCRKSVTHHGNNLAQSHPAAFAIYACRLFTHIISDRKAKGWKRAHHNASADAQFRKQVLRDYKVMKRLRRTDREMNHVICSLWGVSPNVKTNAPNLFNKHFNDMTIFSHYLKHKGCRYYPRGPGSHHHKKHKKN